MSAARRALVSAALGLVILASGCATVQPGSARASATPPPKEDPWESFNRKVYAFNEVVDENLLKPVATAYRKVVPQLVRTGVSNFFGNLGDVWSAANHLLQGKVHHGLDMGMRVATNTFFGLGGLLDPATEFGLVRRSEDFGQTLGRWGVGPGPYLMLPLLGPSTLRDTGGLIVDRQASPSQLAKTDAGNYAITTLQVVDLRASLLDAGRLLDEVSLDKYSFLRQAYLSRRLDQVYDGAPPMETFDDDPGDSEPATPAKVAPAKPPSAPASTPSGAPK
jgi:phospholipid-binding lipoprotein MlaA